MRRYAFGFLMALLLPGCGDAVGTELESFAAIESTYADWVIMGKFGPDGPFEVTEQIDYEMGASCKFEHRGSAHKYSAMPGYAYRLLKLDGGGKESTVLLRTAKRE